MDEITTAMEGVIQEPLRVQGLLPNAEALRNRWQPLRFAVGPGGVSRRWRWRSLSSEISYRSPRQAGWGTSFRQYRHSIALMGVKSWALVAESKELTFKLSGAVVCMFRVPPEPPLMAIYALFGRAG